MTPASAAAAPALRRPPRGGWESHRRRVTAMLLALPLAAIVILFVVPTGMLVWLSLSGADGLSLRAYDELLRPVYFRLMLFTFELALVVTLLCLVIGYPLAYLLASLRGGALRAMTIVLLLALWLSILARTYGWIIILQRNGIVNNLLLEAGLVEAPLALVYNATGVYIGMVHILLPFMVITLIPMLRAIDPGLLRAALSLGASPWRVFRRIYLPLSLPGVLAGSMLVFTMALGFFITPAVLGGGRTSTIVMAIRNQVQTLVDLPLAAATSVVLLAASILCLALAEKAAGIDRLFGAGSR